MINEPAEPVQSNPLAEHLGILADLTKLGDRANDATHFYELLLESCERLFDNEIEQHVFEDQLRYMFGIQVRTNLLTLTSLLNFSSARVQDVHD